MIENIIICKESLNSEQEKFDRKCKLVAKHLLDIKKNLSPPPASKIDFVLCCKEASYKYEMYAQYDRVNIYERCDPVLSFYIDKITLDITILFASRHFISKISLSEEEGNPS